MFNLRRYFSLTSAAVIIVITIVLAIFYRQYATSELIEIAERQNVILAQSLANSLWPQFSSYVMSVSERDADALRARPETAEIHKNLKELTAEIPVLKVKIYNLDGLTVYSSEPSQIGADKGNNPRFLRTEREGAAVSQLSHRETFSAFSGIVEERDLVESYVPIHGRSGRVEGVFELYADVTPLVVRIADGTTELVVVLLLSFGLMYGCLFLIVRRADLILKKQYIELENEVAERKQAEAALLEAHKRLEERVQDRTTALQKANADLKAEVAERTRAEEALRASEARFAGILDIAPDAVISVDEGQCIHLFNQGAEAIFGYSADEVLGQSLDMLLPSRFREEHHKNVEAFASAPEISVLTSERAAIVGLRKNGTEFPAEASISKLERGAETVFTTMLHDITKRKTAEETLLAAKESAELASRAKSEFLASMSHELRTPLNAILGFSEIIKGETFGPIGSAKYRDYAEDIYISGHHLLSLINDVLDLSKVEAGMDKLYEEAIEVPELTQSVLKLVRQRAENVGLEIELELPDDLPLLHADERKLKQILVNLLSNAIKFTAASGKVTLRASCPATSGHVFQVIDTGIGIAPEDIPKALSRFGQVDGNLDRKYEGAGLGLPLSTALVELHGGCLDLQSELGVGTTVTVRFPATRIMRSQQETHLPGVDDRAVS